MIIVVPFSIDEPTKASWYISVTADVNCICTVTAIFPPLPPQTCYGIRGGEDSSMTARGLRIMVDMMSRTDRLKMLCVEPGTHPFFHNLVAHVIRAVDVEALLIEAKPYGQRRMLH